MAVLKVVKDTIDEVTLARVQVYRDKVERLREQLKKAEVDRDVAEEDVLVKLRNGFVTTGRIQATIEQEEGQCRPPWKDLYLGKFENPKAAEAEARKRFPPETKDVLKLAVLRPRAVK